MEWYGFVQIGGKPNFSNEYFKSHFLIPFFIKKSAKVNGDDVVIACLQDEEDDLTGNTSWATGKYFLY